MTPQARMLVAGLGILLLLIVLRALRNHRIQFEYSILWICLSVVLVLAAVFQRSADRVAAWVGIDYPPAFYFLLCFFLVLVILFHLSARLSTLSDQIRKVAQERAIESVDRPGPSRAGERSERVDPATGGAGGPDAGGGGTKRADAGAEGKT